MGLPGGILDDGHALGQHTGQHDVHGGAHRNHVQIDLPTGQAAAGHLGADQAVAHVYIGPHRDEALDMLVDGAAAQVAAAGEGHLRPAEAAQQSAHQIVAGTDPAG